MASPKVTSFIIAMALISLFAGVWGLFSSDLATNYATPSDYNSSQIDLFEKSAQLNQNAQEVKEAVEDFTNPDSALDVIGAFFNSGYKALKTTASSFDVFFGLLQGGMSLLSFQGGDLFMSVIVIIVIVLLFIGVFIAAIVKRDL